MKKNAGLWKYLLSSVFLMVLCAANALAYDVSGNVSASSGGKRVFLQIDTPNGRLGTSIASAPGAYTIRGVPAGTNNAVVAFVDTLDTGSRHYSDPYGSSGVFTVTNSNYTTADISSFKSAAALSTVSPPSSFNVIPSSSTDALVEWKTSNNGQGELADSYKLYWSTSSNVASGSSVYYIPATGDMRGYMFHNLSGSTPLYFAMTSTVSGVESAMSPVVGPISFTSATGYNVSGTVTLPGTISIPSTIPMMIGIVVETPDGPPSAMYSTIVPGPLTSSVSYTVPNVPNGTYRVYALIDINQNGSIDNGDLNASDSEAPSITVNNGDLTTANLTLAGSNSQAYVRTEHYKNGASEGYSINFDIERQSKLPIRVTFQGGPGVTGPIDIALSEWGRFEGRASLGSRPNINDTYSFDVTYSDNSSETITGKVTGIVDSFASLTAPLGTITYNAVPTFSWSAPTSPVPPVGYTYQLGVREQTGMLDWYTKWFPNSTTSMIYNSDNSAGQTSLIDGKSYDWNISVLDADGNSARNHATFSFSSAWIAYNYSPTKPSDIDWLQTAHPVLGKGEYIKANGTYYFATGINGALGSYWNTPSNMYWGNEFAQCNQTTGMPLLTSTKPSAFVLADLSFINNTQIEGFTSWPGQAPSITIAPTNFPSYTVGLPFTYQMSASGGSGSYTWSVWSGALPGEATGSIDSTTGVISATPSAPGEYLFIIRVTDSLGAFAEQFNIIRVMPGGGSTVYSLTGGVQDCSASTCVNLQGVTVTTVGLSPELSTTSDVNGLFTLNIPTTTTLNSLPATAQFHLVFSKASFNNSASSQMQFTGASNIADRPFALYGTANLTSWVNTPGTGVIRSRVVDSTNLVSGYISGATVTASTASGPLTVEYVDPSSGLVVATGSTGSNGIYIIRNIAAGAQVTVTATAPNYTNFQTKQFTVYADTVSQGRISGVASGAADTNPPTVPANLTTNAVSASQVNVSWNSSTDNVGVTYYKVFRDGNLVAQPSGATNTFWSDTTVAAMTTYSYSVAACDAANNCSAQSSPMSVATPSGGIIVPVTFSGTVSYSGTKTGYVHVSVQTNNGTLGTAIQWTTGMTSANYTIRGVPPNNVGNTITAYLDSQDTGIRTASSPAGSSSGSTATARDITLSAPAQVAPGAPQNVEVKPGDSAVLIAWQPNKVNNVIDADYYDIYWDTTAQVSTSSAGKKLSIPAGLDSPVTIGSLTNGTNYYFMVVPRAGSLTGTASAVVGPITVGARTGLNTVSGTVTYNGTIPAGTPLLIAVAGTGSDKGIGTVYFKSIANAAASQPFSISGIPDGGYEVYIILDLNKDGIIGNGDISNTNNDQAPIINLSGGAGTAMGTIALVSKNSTVSVMTEHFKNGTNEWFNVNGSISGQLKRPVSVTLDTAPASSTQFYVPMDLTVGDDKGKDIQFWGGNNVAPVVGDTYSFTIRYSDGTSESGVTAAITGVINNYPVNPTISNPVSTVPTFSWSAPTVAPAGNYQYSLWIDSINNNQMWEQWSIPSSITSVTYGSGSSSSSALQVGTEYKWTVSVRDQNGNKAATGGNFTPTVSGAAGDTTAPALVSTVPANNATGVSINAAISLTFSEAVKGMPDLTAALKNNATNQYVQGFGSSTADSKTHTFVPSAPLTPGTTYSIQFSTVTDLVGNALPVTTLTFTTAAVADTTPPTVVSTVPANNATGVALTAAIAITFSEAVKGMPDPATALKNNATQQYVAGTPSESTDKKTMIFTPNAPLSPSTTYSIQMTAVTDLAGNKLPATTLTFTTQAAVNLTTSALPTGGAYNTAKDVVLTSSVAGSTIYYTVDGSTPTTSSSVYSAPIAITSTTTLKFFSYDATSATSESVRSVLYSIDSTAPVTTASLASGSFNTAQSVSLTANEAATIFYTTNGALPTITSPIYSRPLVIASTTTLKFFARDTAGNKEAVQAILYTIDSTPPKVTASPEGGVFSAAQNITLSADETATIYYTTDGTEPTTASSVYSSSIPVSFTTTLKFFAKDTAGNTGVSQTAVYTIDNTAPALNSTIPANNATGVSIGTKISVTFSEAVTGLPDVAAVLYNETSKTYVAGTVVSSADNMIHTFIPAAQLIPGTTYSIQFTTVKDMAGNALPLTTLTFTTAAPVAIDTIPPLSTVSIATGAVFTSVQSVELKANEAARIYYTTDGTTPTASSNLYTAPIVISATTNLKFFAVDTAGNSEVDKNSVWYYVVPSGDINQDSKVDISDALKMLEIAVGRVDATAAMRKNADVAPLVNGIPSPDGKIDIGDVVVTLRRIVSSVTW